MAGVCLLFSYAATCQQTNAKDSTRLSILQEVVVSFNKFGDLRKNSSQKIDILSSKTIERFNSQNTGDLLANSGNVFVQKSQQGGSSPVIRGFEASRVLLVIDGVRMNNAIYRSGHLQNVITVDQNMLDRVEIMYGPASTLYGSDALGGIVHLRTKNPELSKNSKLFVQGNSFTRYSSANEENTFHANMNLGGTRWAWMQSYTYSNFGDLRMGSHYPKDYPEFGNRKQYIDNINGIDSIVINSDSRVQKFSGYKQWDMMQKFLFKASDKISHQLNVQYSNTNNVPRYDRLQDLKSGLLRYASWYYGPQERALVSYEVKAQKIAGFDQLVFNINHQLIRESRQTREYKRYDRFDSRREKLGVTAWSLDFQKKWANNQLTLGTDAQLNQLESEADRTNLLTAAKEPLDTRYPDGNNSMNYAALYAQHQLRFNNEKLVLNDGLRLQHTNLHSRLDKNFFSLPYNSIHQQTQSITGNLGLVYLINETDRISGNFSSGFRAPNIDDLAKIFESSTSAKQVVFPNPSIKPEYTYNFDLSFSKNLGSKLQWEGTIFYTILRNALVKAPFSINGKDSILYNGVNCQVLANQNKNKAQVYGFTTSFQWNLAPGLLLNSSLSYTKGYFQTDALKTSLVYKKNQSGYRLGDKY